MRFSSTLFFALILCVGTMLSCKEDEDSVKPTITLQSPSNNNNFAVYETIVFEGSAEDDQQLDFVTLEVLDVDQVRALPPVTLNPSGKTFEFTRGIYIDDIHLESGTYYCVVTAGDGTNETRKWIEVTINEAPKEVLGYYVISEPAANDVEVWQLDTGLNAVVAHSLPNHDYGSSEVNSYSQQVIVAGAFSGDLEAYNIATGLMRWSDASGSNLPYPWFTKVQYSDDDHLLYASLTSQGQIRAFDPGGGLKVNASALSGYHPVNNFVLDDKLISEQQAISGSASSLVTYFKNSGAIEHDAALNRDIVRMFKRSNSELYIFGNVGSQGIMSIYDAENFSFWEPHNINGSIRDAAQFGPNSYFLALDDGIYTYTYSNNSLLSFLSGIVADQIELDDVNNELMILVGNTVSWYSLSGQFLRSYTHPVAPNAIHIWYNK